MDFDHLQGIWSCSWNEQDIHKFSSKSLTKSRGTKKKKKKPRVHILQENSVYFDSSNILVNIHQLWHLGLKSLIDKKKKTKFLVGQIQLM